MLGFGCVATLAFKRLFQLYHRMIYIRYLLFICITTYVYIHIKISSSLPWVDWTVCKLFVFKLWISVLLNPSVNNFPALIFDYLILQKTVSLEQSLLPVLSLKFLFWFGFPLQLIVWTAKVTELDFSTDMHLYFNLTVYESNLICCFLKSSSLLKYFQFPADVPKFLFSPSSFPVSSVFIIIGQTVHAVGSSYKPQICWFFWLTYLSIRSLRADNQGQAATNSKVLMCMDLFLLPPAIFFFPVPYRANILKILSSLIIGWR